MLINYVTNNRVEEGTSLWDLLGVPESADTLIVDKAWQRSDHTSEERFAWKALRDPLYRELYRRKPSVDALIHAGFFDDGLDIGVEDLHATDPRFLCTPTGKLHMGLSTHQDQYILVTTGAFSPVHNGHIEMMKAAIAQIKREGNVVAGAYVVPGHDSYVGGKYGGTAGIPAVERVHMLELAFESDPDIMVDPWAARYLPCEVNFTDVLRRMRRFQEEHFRKDLKYAYVYGSDNEGFADVLEASDYRAMPIQRTQESSTAVRQGAADQLPESVREYLNSSWPRGVYQIRDDKLGDDTLRSQVIETLSQTMSPNPIEVLNINNQRLRAREMLLGRKCISMDPLFLGDYHLDICRTFHPADFQIRGSTAQRPGTETLHDQVAAIPKGNYVLVEDDVATGGTLAEARARLTREGITITEELILANLDTPSQDVMDVVDARDFMLDVCYGGLVVWRLDYLCRAPYLLPFVNLRTRAKVPPHKEIALSLALWKLNRDHLVATNPDKRFTDCGDDFFLFAVKHGWDPDDTLVDYCDFYIKVLEEAQGKPCTPA